MSRPASRARAGATPRPVALRLLALALAGLLVGGCKIFGPVLIFGGSIDVHVNTVQGFNRDTPVAVEFLMVYDRKLLGQITQLSASAWFSGRAQFLQDHPPGAGSYDHYLREWVPGQNVTPQTLHFRRGAEATVVFASYGSPGQHRATMPPRTDFTLQLQADGFRLQ